MRKVDDGEKKKKEKKIVTFIVATNVVVRQPTDRRTLMPLLAHWEVCGWIIGKNYKYE